jgi:hypothetical protein
MFNETNLLLFEDYHFIVEKRFVCPSDPERNAGGSVGSWKGHSYQTSQTLWVRRSVVPGTPGLGFGVGLTTPPRKNIVTKTPETMEDGKTHTGL